MRNAAAVIYSIVLLVSFPVFSFADATQTEEVNLQAISYIVDGNTSVNALKGRSELNEGDIFESIAQLEKMAAAERQDLINRRVFETVEYRLQSLGVDAQGRQAYHLFFDIVDANSFYVIPYPDYDTNTGLRLGVKTYWDNILGSMSNAYLGMAMDLRSNGAGGVEVGEWYINPALRGIRLTNDIKLSVSVITQYVEEDFVDVSVPANSYDYSYYSTGGSVSAGFRLPYDMSYSAYLGATGRYLYEGNLGPNSQRPWSLDIGHSFGYGRVDWQQNMRKGFKINLGNSYSLGESSDGFKLVSDVDLTLSYYFPFWKRFNLYTRANTFYQWGEMRRIATKIRGVYNHEMAGYTGAVFNLTLAFQFWRFENVWDAQIHPFVDIGIAYNNESFDPARDFRMGAGFDLVLYLDAIPNLVAVGSIGLDPLNLDKNDLFGGLEITISSSLFY